MNPLPVYIVIISALLGAGLLIWIGESDQEYWATVETINGAPSLATLKLSQKIARFVLTYRTRWVF